VTGVQTCALPIYALFSDIPRWSAYWNGLTPVVFVPKNTPPLVNVPLMYASKLYDAAKSNLNELQIKIRIKKLLGSGIKIEFGNFLTFANKLEEMTGIVRRGAGLSNILSKTE
jgi:hypothetical protein